MANKKVHKLNKQAGKLSDKVCAIKSCTNLVPILAILHDDPFCSNVCAREFYNNPLPDTSPEGNKGHKPAGVQMYYRKPKVEK